MGEWINIGSSCLDRVMYDGTDLYVEFPSGKQFVYKDVPAEVYTTLVYSPSSGSFFRNVVANGYRGAECNVGSIS